MAAWQHGLCTKNVATESGSCWRTQPGASYQRTDCPVLPRALCLFIAAHRYQADVWSLMVTTGCIHSTPYSGGREAERHERHERRWDAWAAGSSIMRHYHTTSKHRARIDGSRGPKVAFKEVVHPVKPPLGSPDGQIGLSGPFLHPSQSDCCWVTLFVGASKLGHLHT